MTDVRPLLLLLEKHDRTRDEAIAAQQRARTASQAAIARSDQLRVYRLEYDQRWSSRFRSDSSVELLQCYQGFAERLSTAVDQQADVVAQAAAYLAFADAAVHEAELRCLSVRRLIERRLDEQHRAAERRDDKNADETAARLIWTRNAQRSAAEPNPSPT